jgi:hypothetical protein
VITHCGRLFRIVADWASKAEGLVKFQVVCVQPGDDLVVKLGFRGRRRYYERLVILSPAMENGPGGEVFIALDRMREDLAEAIRADNERPRRRH